MSKKIRFRDANGKGVSGNFEINGGRITVSAPDGRTKMAGIDESMLNPQTLARALLLLLHEEERAVG